jgi:hypothetical protein
MKKKERVKKKKEVRKEARRDGIPKTPSGL